MIFVQNFTLPPAVTAWTNLTSETNSFNYFLPKKGPISNSRNVGGIARGGRGEATRYVGRVGDTGDTG